LFGSGLSRLGCCKVFENIFRLSKEKVTKEDNPDILGKGLKKDIIRQYSVKHLEVFSS
jgi:hypothetical protein